MASPSPLLLTRHTPLSRYRESSERRLILESGNPLPACLEFATQRPLGCHLAVSERRRRKHPVNGDLFGLSGVRDGLLRTVLALGKIQGDFDRLLVESIALRVAQAGSHGDRVGAA